MPIVLSNFGLGEVVIVSLLLVFIFFIFEGIGNYGNDTALGFWGSVLVAIIVSPLVALVLIFFLKRR